ncbi:hypothetical protein [Bacteroides luti]|nr:hypothetical protein [Bacteroides luti]
MNTHIKLKSFLATFFLLLSFGINAQTMLSEKEGTSPTASDYYLPFRVGNYIKLYGWNRNTKYSYVKTDKINGVTYFLEQGEEWNDQFSGIFRNMWLREDEEGNIVIGAYGTKNDGDINSAVILPTPSKYFPNSYLTVNSYATYSNQDEVGTDSVISTTATAGAYTNCIQVRSTNKYISSGAIRLIEDNYYAYNIGLVMQKRIFPASQVHTNYIVEYVANSPTGINNLRLVDNAFNFKVYTEQDAIVVANANYGDKISVYTPLGTLLQTMIATNNETRIIVPGNQIYLIKIADKVFKVAL